MEKSCKENGGEMEQENLLLQLPVKETATSNEDNLFDELIESIGNDHKFQFRFNLLYNFFLVLVVTMPCFNIVICMTIPDHWCHVPGRMDNTSVDAWKSLTLPRDIDPKTQAISYSHCRMYSSEDKNETVECQHGWEYDRQWFSQTAPSQEDWVCDKELYTTNTFVISRVGEIIGTFVFGQLGDQVGRRPVFYVSLFLLVVGRVWSAFTAHAYIWFLAASLVGSMASISVFQSPLVICMEVSSSDKRAHITFMQCLGWVSGMCLLPMIAWWVGDWALLMVLTTVPSAIFFFTYKLLPESPRWLASRGKVEKSIEMLQYIASVNGTKVPSNAVAILNKIADKREKVFGIPSLFSSWRLAKNTVIMVTCWVICGLAYFVLILNISNMAGNPFMNFFWQSLVELPGYVLGRIYSDKLGRRWTQVGSYLLAFISCILVLALYNVNAPWLITVLVSCIKCGVTITFYMVWLQAMEIYPTCIRQTGTSFGILITNIACIGGPYIVYLGQTYDSRIPYFILTVLTFIGGILASFLPETYNKKLPETLEDAHSFGKNQKYWSFALK